MCNKYMFTTWLSEVDHTKLAAIAAHRSYSLAWMMKEHYTGLIGSVANPSSGVVHALVQASSTSARYIKRDFQELIPSISFILQNSITCLDNKAIASC